MHSNETPKVVGLVVKKEGMSDLIKDIYIEGEIENYFNMVWDNSELYSVRNITEELLPYIKIPENDESNLDQILKRGFSIELISLNGIKRSSFDNKTPNTVLDVLETYYTRINREVAFVKISDDIDYS